MPGTPPPIVDMNPPGYRPTLNGRVKPPYEPPPCVTVPTRKLHPLHTPELIAERVLNTGEYPDPQRGTGRTTILALERIVDALKNPGKPIGVRDHHEAAGLANHRALVRLIQDTAGALNLSHVYVDESRLTVIFERRTAPHANPFAGFRPLATPTPQRGY